MSPLANLMNDLLIKMYLGKNILDLMSVYPKNAAFSALSF